jgi:uncharacterized RDD family membrane protein YckC
MASFGYASTLHDTRGMPDPAALPEAYEGVLWRRTLAYFVDLCVIGVLAVFVWIVFALLWLLTLLLSGPRSATIGMRLFDLELRSVTGERPSFLQALIQTALFYITVGATCALILLVVLFNRHKRTLHDMLAGTVIVWCFPTRWANAQDPWRP